MTISTDYVCKRGFSMRNLNSIAAQNYKRKNHNSSYNYMKNNANYCSCNLTQTLRLRRTMIQGITKMSIRQSKNLQQARNQRKI